MPFVQSNFDVGILEKGEYIIRTIINFRWAITETSVGMDRARKTPPSMEPVR